MNFAPFNVSSFEFFFVISNVNEYTWTISGVDSPFPSAFGSFEYINFTWLVLSFSIAASEFNFAEYVIFISAPALSFCEIKSLNFISKLVVPFAFVILEIVAFVYVLPPIVISISLLKSNPFDIVSSTLNSYLSYPIILGTSVVIVKFTFSPTFAVVTSVSFSMWMSSVLIFTSSLWIKLESIAADLAFDVVLLGFSVSSYTK